MSGPLRGIRIVEVAGIGPTPFAAMMLADMGADVVRIDRSAGGTVAGFELSQRRDLVNRGRRSIMLDLKNADDAETALRLVEKADGLVEGFRPGVMERLGLGPQACLARNPRLVYGRMTGWGQEGPLAPRAGHDITYIALAGALYPSGYADRPPTPPLNLLGDFGGGGMMMAFGMVCAILHARETGEGQVVDANITEGTAALTTLIHGLRAMGVWTDGRAENMLDGSAPFYTCYECKCGGFVAVGALEAKFYDALCALTGITSFPDPDRLHRGNWPAMREAFAAVFAARTRDEWAAETQGLDACVAPVLTLAEAPRHPHARARGSFIEQGGIVQPAPSPRFSLTPGSLSHLPPLPGEHSGDILADWGIKAADTK